MEKGLIICVLLAVLASGCNKDPVTDCFVRSGEHTAENRPADQPFQKIHAYGRVDVEIVQQPEFSVSVEGGENLLENVTTEVENGILTIDNESNCNALRNFEKPKVTVSLPEIEEIGYYGNGIVTSKDTLRSDTFLADLWSGGDRMEVTLDCKMVFVANHASTCDLFLNGITDEMSIYKRGLGKIHAFALRANNCYIDAYTSTDTEVFITDKLNYRLRYYGDIYVKGNPEINKLEHTGEGSIIEVN